MNTKNKKIIFFSVCILLLALFFTFPVSAAKNNIALECKIDYVCGESGENTSAQMLVDFDRRYDTKWEADDGENHPGEPHLIILDFEADKTFDSIKLIKASLGADDFGRTELNASGFGFEASVDKISWTEIVDVTGNGGEDIYEISFAPVTARYLKLIITHPEQDEESGENKTVRLYDLKVFETEYVAEGDYPDDIFDPVNPSAADSAKIPPETSDPPVLFAARIILLIISAVVLGLAKKHKKYRRI